MKLSFPSTLSVNSCFKREKLKNDSRSQNRFNLKEDSATKSFWIVSFSCDEAKPFCRSKRLSSRQQKDQTHKKIYCQLFWLTNKFLSLQKSFAGNRFVVAGIKKREGGRWRRAFMPTDFLRKPPALAGSSDKIFFLQRQFLDWCKNKCRLVRFFICKANWRYFISTTES